ncbi:13314_t:CDS:1, partial [Racocetra fulgida]
GIQNQSDIEQKFKETFTLINELEADNNYQHNSYKYKYHTTYHNYLSVVGDEEGANKHEKIAKKYEKFVNAHTEEMKPVLYATDVESSADNQDSNLENKILKELDQIRPILKDELTESDVVETLISEIKRVFEKLSKVPKTFEGYREAIDCEIYMNRIVEGLVHEKLIVLKGNSNSEKKHDNKSSKIKNVSIELIGHLRCLEAFAHDAAYSKRIEIVSYLSDSSNKLEILFRNVINTEEEINKRARILSSWFHPDKTKNPTSPYMLRDKHKSQGDELFKLILGFKEHLLNKLKKTLELDNYVQYGRELWITTLDYNNASKGQWDKLKELKEEIVKELPSESLKQHSMIYGELAYHQYRAACKIADRAKLLKQQVKLREYMALCLYHTNKFLEAPLYALAAILLQVKNSTNFTQQELDYTKSVLDKVNSRKEEVKRDEEGVSSDTNTDTKLESDLTNAMSLIRTNDKKELSLGNKAVIQNSINKNLISTASKLLVKAERRLVCYETSYKEILQTIKHAKSYKIKGAAVSAGGLGVVLTAGVNFALAGPLGLFAGTTCLVAGLCYGYYLFKKGDEMFREPRVRERLNKLINKALSAYDGEKYQEFIKVLSEEYDENKRLLICQDSIGIVEKDIIKTLKSHGFRSDGIAYLLVVIGE